MNFEEFRASLKLQQLPENLNPALRSLWYDAQGNWTEAHTIAQQIEDFTGAWIHGYLHRKEGDHSNAAYWYSRAGKNPPNISLQEEWELIVRQILNNHHG